MSLKPHDKCPKCARGGLIVGPRFKLWAPADLQELGLHECLQYFCNICEFSIQVACADAKPQKPREVA